MLDLNVPAIEKLVDYTASGIGAIAGPILAPWKASREGKARVIAAKADAEVHSIEAESGARSLQIIADAQTKAKQAIAKPIDSERSMVEITRDDITQRIEFQERKRLANVRSVLHNAAIELDDKEVPDHEPDHDWTARFFESVQDISSEEMQRLWAKILSGEVQSPGDTSLRTLETLRNMSKIDAEIFSDACNFVFLPLQEQERGIILRGDEYYEISDAVHYTKLLHLQDCGLLTIEQIVYNIISNTQFFPYQDLLLKVSKNKNTDSKIQIPVFTLTRAGTELYRIVQPRVCMDYLRCFAKWLESQNCQLFSTQIINRYPDGRLDYRENFTPIESTQPDSGALHIQK